MNDKLQAIREACIKANPEIGALPRFPEDSDTRKAILALEKIAATHYQTKEFVETASLHLKNYEEERKSAYIRELEGKYPSRRPIRLADVLLAIGQRSITDKSLVAFIYTNYNLRADDLPLQSTETINFLYELLTKQ